MSSPVKRITIADDHDAVRQGVRTFIEANPNWRVVGEANNGRDALEAVRTLQPDIAIVDYSLPFLNGLQLTQSIRKSSPRTEILIYSMHDYEDIVIETLRAGARAYVLKSETSEHLLAAIEALCIRRPYFSGRISETLLERVISSYADESDRKILTLRENEIVQLIAEGYINKQIAKILDISVKTVETHRASAMRKLNLRSTADLVRYAIRNRIIEA